MGRIKTLEGKGDKLHTTYQEVISISTVIRKNKRNEKLGGGRVEESEKYNKKKSIKKMHWKTSQVKL